MSAQIDEHLAAACSFAAPARALPVQLAPETGTEQVQVPPAPAEPGMAAAADPALLETPVPVRNIALGLIAAIAVVFALQWGQRFFIPLVFSVIASYTLNPLVVWLERIRIARALGAGV